MPFAINEIWNEITNRRGEWYIAAVAWWVIITHELSHQVSLYLKYRIRMLPDHRNKPWAVCRCCCSQLPIKTSDISIIAERQSIWTWYQHWTGVGRRGQKSIISLPVFHSVFPNMHPAPNLLYSSYAMSSAIRVGHGPRQSLFPQDIWWIPMTQLSS